VCIVDQQLRPRDAAVTVLTNERARTYALTAADWSKLSMILWWVLLQVARALVRNSAEAACRRRRRRIDGVGGGPKMDMSA